MGVVSSYLCHPEQAAKSVEPKPKWDLCTLDVSVARY